MTQYIYDAEGNRVGKGTIQPVIVNGQPTLSCDTTINGFSLTNEYVLGQGGEQITEFDGNGNWLHTNGYPGGQLLVTSDSLGWHYQLADWLGTRREQVSPIGVVEETCMSLPFGDSLQCSGPGSDATEHHFTGKERDTESGNDYFKYRYYASNTGRWLSPDPSGLSHVNLADPQQLNLYNYVGNNPLTRADLDGLGAGAGVVAFKPFSGETGVGIYGEGSAGGSQVQWRRIQNRQPSCASSKSKEARGESEKGNEPT